MFQSWYATCPRGAEPALRDELQALGAKGIRPAPGIVRFTGERETALRACLELRCALRVLEPVGEFPAEDADALYAGARTLAWDSLLAPGQTFAVSASGKTPKLNHTHFVGLRIKDAVCDVLREKRGERPDVDPQRPDVLLIAHLANGRCSLSLDLAGDLLSNRGYRVRTVEAPLREALAAALRRALHPAFRASLRGLENPYDHGDIAQRVLVVLAATPLQGLRDKRFFDLADDPWRAQLHLVEAA